MIKDTRMSETNKNVGECLLSLFLMKDGKMGGDESPAEASGVHELLQQMDKKINALEEELKVRMISFNDEEFLFNNSAAFKRLHFSVWLHTKYYQLQYSDAKDPRIDDVDALTLEIQKYIPTSLEYNQRRCHHNENHYTDKLQELSFKMSAWAKQICNDQNDFTEGHVRAILASLTKLSITGEKTAEGFEEYDLYSKFTTRRHQKILYHHLIALAIYEHVLSSFAFGMDRMASKQLHAIQNALLTQGTSADHLHSNKIETDFEQILTARQVLGTAALHNVENIKLLERKQDLTLELTRLFSPFFPSQTCKTEDLFSIVDTAVDLRNDITEERAIYSCYWYCADCNIDLDAGFCVFDGWRDDDHPFLICTFPGFSQSIKLHDGSIKEMCLKPAVIEMEW